MRLVQATPAARAMERSLRSLDSILADEPSVHTLPDAPEPKAPEAEPASEAAADKGETPKAEAKTNVQKQAPVGGGDDVDHDEGDVPESFEGLKRALAAARGDKRKERKKWQEVEKRAASLEGQLSVLRQQLQGQKQAPQAQAEDQETAFFTKPIDTVNGWVEQRVKSVAEQQHLRFIEGLREMTRVQFSDFDDAERAFFEAAKADPHLMARLNASPNPPLFAYQTGKQIQRLSGVSSIDELEEKLRAEIRAELESKQAQTQTPAKTIPPKSIATARGSGSGVTKAWAGPRSLDDILG